MEKEITAFNGSFSYLFVILDDYTGSFKPVFWSDTAFVPEVERRGKSLPGQNLSGSPYRSLFLPSPSPFSSLPLPVPRQFHTQIAVYQHSATAGPAPMVETLLCGRERRVPWSDPSLFPSGDGYGRV